MQHDPLVAVSTLPVAALANGKTLAAQIVDRAEGASPPRYILNQVLRI
jgi:hypothetical protein